ncbi:LysM peptidoglycan-binding domain-containing protein [Limosilactobacillus ingluviei]|uniref:aggregation-promoting factor n=2 Tax=Limosilactobacillus ingluviei TaxID=148604 RepID=UPI001959824E|nr:LysM domain-containing protein [Limosilactobacillus ingluviei]MBM6728835.1 LysM peptidoglycan-binding domain-containing protein [Limosilactobacillus ingluviei]
MLKKSMLTTAATLGIAAFGIAAGSTVASADTTYTVQAGDTLSSISQKFANSSVDKLAQDNNIQNVNLIYVGQQLLIKDNGETTQAPAQTAAQAAPVQTTQSQAPVYYAQQPAAQSNYNYQAPATNSYTANLGGNEAAAQAWIAQRESGGSYTARNGQYIGKYQLSAAYLNGDYSAANQERVAQQYVASRYGSWTNAQAFWQQHGWY